MVQFSKKAEVKKRLYCQCNCQFKKLALYCKVEKSWQDEIKKVNHYFLTFFEYIWLFVLYKKLAILNEYFILYPRNSKMNPQQQKQLRINVGAVKRLKKEVASYQKELQEAQDNVANATYEPGSFEMKNLNNLRDEAEATVRDVERRLDDYKKKLRTSLKDVESQFPDDELVVEAKQLLA